MQLDFIKYAELLLLLAAAVLSDVLTYRIKNAITAVFVTAGLITNLVGGGFQALLISLLAAVLPVIILFLFFGLRMLGAGDIKLLSAIGAIAGINFVIYSIAFSFLAGGAIAVLIMLLKRNMKKRAVHLYRYLKSCFLTRSLQPYTDFTDKNDGSIFRFSYAIACGTVFGMLAGKLL